MRARALLAALGVVVLGALALGRAPSSGPARPPVRGRGAPAAPAPEPSAVPVDPARIRDVFRFADEPRQVAGPARRPSATSGEEPLASSSTTGLRLVGLVRRAGRLVAALAADGEVEIAGPGETAAGVTVLSVGEDRVRVRRADGREETLVLP